MNNVIGYFLPRPNISRVRINDITQELALYELEAKILLLAIEYIEKKKLTYFDSTIGDRKCQTRSSMLIDCMQNLSDLNNKAQKEKPSIEKLLLKITTLLHTINNYTVEENIQLVKTLKTESLSSYITNHEINHNLPNNLKLLCLCLISTYKKEQISSLINFNITLSKVTKLLNFGAKATLCDLSIQYERDLAKQYHLSEVETCLQQLEKKGFCTMTAFFPSFKPIIEKMKHLDQPFAKKTTHFCQCGRVRKNSFEIFSYKNNTWIQTPEKLKNLEEPIMVIYGFQFPGSFEKLKKTLNIPLQEISIPKPYHVMCACDKPFQEPVIDNMEHGVLANFAHHPQFTTEAEIDWQGLGLVHSNLHKEYEFLKTLHGFSADDMSKFCINHIYPATIKDAIELDSPSIHINITEQRKDLATHHDAHCPC